MEASDRGKAVYVWHQFITLKCVGDIAQELAALEAKSEVLRSARHTHSHSTLTSTSRAHLHSHSQLQLKSSKASRKGKKRKDAPASREMPSRARQMLKIVPRASSQPIVSSDDMKKLLCRLKSRRKRKVLLRPAARGALKSMSPTKSTTNIAKTLNLLL